MQQVTEQCEINVNTRVTRPVLVIVGVCALTCMTVIIFFSIGVADVEFKHSVAHSRRTDYYLPRVIAWYPGVYSWGWSGPIVGVLWLLILLYRKSQSVCVLLLYLAFIIMFSTLSMTATFTVIYLLNQPVWAS
jgi:hypothetical protein